MVFCLWFGLGVFEYAFAFVEGLVADGAFAARELVEVAEGVAEDFLVVFCWFGEGEAVWEDDGGFVVESWQEVFAG